MISVNRAKAEALTLNRLRANRAARLEALDVQLMKAIEAGKDISEISAAKQALRDITRKPLDSLTVCQLATITLDEALSL